MNDSEIKTGLDRMVDGLRDQLGALKTSNSRFERLADEYWRQICRLKSERDILFSQLTQARKLADSHLEMLAVVSAGRDELQTRVNNLEALHCATRRVRYATHEKTSGQKREAPSATNEGPGFC